MRFSSLALNVLLFLVAGFGGGSLKGIVFAQEEATTEATTVVTPPENAETFSFDAQVDKMLHIVVNSLYQHPEVFLRELISNASDALDKIRYLILSEPDKYKPQTDIPLQVQIEYNQEQKTLTIRDTGVGMTKDDMIANLGTVARSGTTKFIESLKEAGNADSTMSQIGQFGVGFYSAFLVADKVSVASKNPTDPVQHVWESNNGSPDFVIYPDPRGNTMERGTEITLHLKEDSLEYTDATRLKGLAQHYSEFVIYPISLRTTNTVQVEVEDEEEESIGEEKKDDEDLEVTDEDEEPEEKSKKMKEVTTFDWEELNGHPALWTREKEEISDDEYQAFYHVLTGDEYTNATTWVHFNAEGNINFKSILYLPKDVPASYRYGNIEPVEGAVRLYVRKVLIGDKFDIMPKYLGMIRGVVDSEDLPLNVNRETLQETKILQVIKKKLVRKAIDLIAQFAKESDEAAAAEPEKDEEGNKVEPTNKYVEWYKKFSPNIKLGMIEDEQNRAKLAKLVRYPTSKSNGELVSLSQYVDNMKDWQDEIYVIGGTSVEEIEKSAFIETFRDKDVEVIYLTDALDEYLVQHVREFNKKKFVQATAENVKFKDEDENLTKRREKVYKKTFQPLTKWLKKLYGNSVLRVQVAKRGLGSVPAIVSSSEYGNSANMERIMRAQAFQHGIDPSGMMSMKVFEINPRHPIIKKLLEVCPPEEEKEGEEPVKVPQETIDAAMMILDMAMLAGGFPINDHTGHNKRLSKVLQERLGLESLKLEPEIDPPEEEDEPPEIDGLDGMGGLNMEDFAHFGGGGSQFMSADDLKEKLNFDPELLKDKKDDKDEL